MGEYLLFWVSKALVDLMIPIVVFVLIFICCLLHALWVEYKRKRCKHVRWFENRVCHSVCWACGKDLGLTGTWPRKQDEEREHG